MIITYQYKIKPSAEQVFILNNWMELLRRHWNFALGQRLDWLNSTRCQINCCSLVSEPIGKVPEKVDYYTQQAELKETKKLFPEYKEIYTEVQQLNLQRLDKAWKRWLIPDKSGKRGGRPKFKKKGELRSISFSRVNHSKAACFLEGNKLKIPKLGVFPVVLHRPIPDGFVLKTATIIKKADGWYVSVSAEDKTVPSLKPIATVKTTVGVDVGLKEFLTTSSGETVPVPQIYRQAQSHLARQQRFLSRQQKESNSYTSQQNKIARIHQRIQRQRKDFHYKTAHKLVREYDLIAVEDLQVRNLARNSKLAKSILDAAWSSFVTILEAVAVKRGVHIVKVNPHNTSQNCSGCGVKVPKNLSVRTHCCPKCNLTLDRDENAAINILNKALQAVGHIVSAGGGLVEKQPVKPETWGFNGVQLALF
ncbi:MAG: transposase [Crinalium sp.]